MTWFKHSTIASDEQRKKCNKKLVQSVPTRWNSTYYMLKRFLELCPFVNELVNMYTSASNMLTVLEIEDIAQIVEIVQPLESATNEISEKSSMAIPILYNR